MTEVFFYILADEATDAPYRFACRLTEKAHASGHRIYLHAADAGVARTLDEMLWVFRQDSFVPHATTATLAADDHLTPVVVGSGEPPTGFDDILISLGGDVSAFFSRFARHNEIVAPPDVSAARSRYRFYKDRGYALTTHRIAVP